MVGRRPQAPGDGDTKPCPRCRDTLVFTSRYPALCLGRDVAGRIGTPTLFKKWWNFPVDVQDDAPRGVLRECHFECH